MVRSHDRASGSRGTASAYRLTPLRAAAARTAGDADPAPEIDALSEVLRTVKLSGALFFVVEATSPWGVSVPPARTFGPTVMPRAQHVVSYHIVLEGRGHASVPGVASARFAAGDVIVFPHGDAYTMLSRPDVRPEIAGTESTAFLREMAEGRLPFVITEGGGGPEHARFVCGFLGCDIRPFNPLLTHLPNLLRIRRPAAERGDMLSRLIEMTLAEARAGRAGAECIRLGLSELIFIEVLRRYLATLRTNRPGWLAALGDPVVGRALRLLHARPAHDWTLNELARLTASSRSVLADRFTRRVGHPPMHYLTQWRMQLAARRLADGERPLGGLAADLGYASEAAFSRAFKRLTGVSPAAWRDRRPAAEASTRPARSA